MKHLRMLLLTLTSAVVLFVAFALGRNYVRAETRGTVPLERLAHRGSELERSLARIIADSLPGQPYPRSWRWYARRERSANGDTIRFYIYRAQDATLIARMLRPIPHIAGGATYVISERELRGPGIGIR